MNFTHFYRRQFRPPIRLYWWRYQYPTLLNFGDELTGYLINKLFGYRTVWASPGECDMAGAGSIIEILQAEAGDHPVAVWGSGFIKPGRPNQMSNLHFRMVRGSLSRSRVADPTIPLGDPGLLLPLAYRPKAVKRYRLGIVPHYLDKRAVTLKPLYEKPDVKIINVFDSVEQVVRDICACECVLSSSLHGLILSDAYGIPNRWLPLSSRLKGGDYKFRDYYSAFNTTPQPFDPRLLSSLDMNDLATNYQPKAGIAAIQNNLLQSFPFGH